MQLCYDIVPHGDGWVIAVIPRRLSTGATAPGFTSKRAAFDVAAALARKLRFLGVSLDVLTEREGPQADRKAS
jgi:hypothetical protein